MAVVTQNATSELIVASNGRFAAQFHATEQGAKPVL